mmetsp:Transcript_12126/g.36560  ORF Transcript_12126/g.36560 Transcript_12126/m.36560 type:complete len:223 (-) Transcript_12126:40-708(-)
MVELREGGRDDGVGLRIGGRRVVAEPRRQTHLLGRPLRARRRLVRLSRGGHPPPPHPVAYRRRRRPFALGRQHRRLHQVLQGRLAAPPKVRRTGRRPEPRRRHRRLQHPHRHRRHHEQATTGACCCGRLERPQRRWHRERLVSSFCSLVRSLSLCYFARELPFSSLLGLCSSSSSRTFRRAASRNRAIAPCPRVSLCALSSRDTSPLLCCLFPPPPSSVGRR